MPPERSAKTIKQAKEAFKQRHSNPLTEKEQKQLQRARILEQRAWAIREREKTRQDAAAKKMRAEREREKGRKVVGFEGFGEGNGDGKRKLDRHGFESSQFCLGAFFGRGAGVKAVVAGATEGGNESAEIPRMLGEEDVEEFEYVDEESLLEALHSPPAAKKPPRRPEQSHSGNMTPPPPLPRPVQSTRQQNTAGKVDGGASLHRPNSREPDEAMKAMPPPPRPETGKPPKPAADDSPPGAIFLESKDDFADPWADLLDSSTQIARELSVESSPKHEQTASHQHIEPPRTTTGSFSSGSFDLTEEDLEELDPTPRTKVMAVSEAAKAKHTERMPPPHPFATARSMLPAAHEMHDISAALAPPPAKTGHNHGEDFTMTQLESFMDDDLQLTQIAPKE